MSDRIVSDRGPRAQPPLDVRIGRLRVRCFAAVALDSSIMRHPSRAESYARARLFLLDGLIMLDGDLLLTLEWPGNSAETHAQGRALIVREGERNELAGVLSPPANIDDTPTLPPGFADAPRPGWSHVRCGACGAAFEARTVLLHPVADEVAARFHALRCLCGSDDVREATP